MGVTGKSSKSLVVAEHVSSPVLLVPLDEICAVKVGSVLSTVTEALLVAVSPAASVAVKVQVTVSEGLTVLGVSCSVLPVEP